MAKLTDLTLAEAREADLLLHVIDASDPERDSRVADVETVLEEIGAAELPQVLVYNKIDLLESNLARVEDLAREGPLRAWVSARDGIGIESLLAAVAQALSSERIHQIVKMPATSGRLRARLHELGLVASEKVDEQGWHVEIDGPRSSIEPLFGLPGGQGDWLKAALLAPTDGATYNQFDNSQP